jgi:hypothetical protein|tara:strand:- start:152 stop:490 length:339 start_codon:yes stop_codon:yes gene_type:complete
MIKPKSLVDNAQLPAAAAAQYTADASLVAALIKRATFTNTDSSARTFSIWIVPSGGSRANSNLIIDDRSVAVDETVDSTELINHVLEGGDSIHAVASAATAITVKISGFEQT